MKIKFLCARGLLAWWCATLQAQIPITTNTVPPVVGVYDQYYLPGPVDEATGAMTPTGSANTTSGANDALTYVAANQTSKGQTFTTGSNPLGYTINSVTVRHILWTNFLSNGTFMSIPSGSSFSFRFGTISGAGITAILTTNATYSGTSLSSSGGSGTGIYFTFNLNGAGIGTLAPNTTYFFEIASSSAYFELHNTRTNSTYVYAGGTAFAGDTDAALDQSGTVVLPTYGGEFAFDASLAVVGAPSVSATANPSGASAGQTFSVTATVTPGVGTVTNVSVNLSGIGGSAAARLVLSSTANVYTNTFTVPSSAVLGSTNLVVTVTDNTPLTGTAGILFSVLPNNRIWNGGSTVDSEWTTTNNWQGGLAPGLLGNNVFFAGTTRLTPDMNNSYNVAELVFSNTAGSFNVGSSVGGTLTVGSGGIADNSANAETLSMQVAMSAAETFSTASGSLILSSNLTGGMDLNATGAGELSFSSTGTNSIGNLEVSVGELNVAAGTLNVSNTQGSSTRVESNATLVVSGTLNILGGSALNGWFPIGVSAGCTGTVVVAGGTINVNDHWGTEVGNESGSGVLTINSGTFINNDAGEIGLLIADGSAVQGTINLNGGALIVDSIGAGAGSGGQFYLNGGTLEPLYSSGSFWNDSSLVTAAVRNGGAVVNTEGYSVTIGQPLVHSTVTGDNAVDGGLTKLGAGTLTLTGGYTYTGTNSVLGGTLNIGLSQGVPATGGDLVVSNAALVLDGSGGATMPAQNVKLETGAVVNLTNYPSVNVISGTGNLLVQTNTILDLSYGSLGGNPTAAGLAVAGSISVTGTNNIINLSGTGFTLGQFPLIKYGSGSLATISGFKLGTLPPGVIGVLVNDTTNQSIDFEITVLGQSLTWYGTNSLWNINTTYNWNNGSAKYLEYGTSPNVYGDLVTFDDTLYNDGTHAQATNVNLTTTLHPSQITENSSLPYSFTGAGSLAGTGALIMNGSGSLTLGTANSYTGGTFLNAGTLVISNTAALGATTNLLTLAGGTLEVAGNMASASVTLVGAPSMVDVLTNEFAQLLLNGSAGTNSLTKTDNGTLALSSAGASGIGDMVVNEGLVRITNGTVVVNATQGNTKVDTGGNLEVDNTGVLIVTNGVNSWFPVGDTQNTTNSLTISGGTMVVQDDWGMEVPRQGYGTLTINSGSLTVQDIGGFNIGLILGDSGATTAQGGTLNLNGGTLVVDQVYANNGVASFYFNGGTLKPTGAVSDFFPSSSPMTAYVRNGGAVVDTAGYSVSIGQPLLHSAMAGDNAVDGGLTKLGTGTLSLNTTNSYTGPTVIKAGALGGTGILSGSLTNNATLAPGNSGSGTLTMTGNITLNAGSTNSFSVNGTTLAGTAIAAGGKVTYGGVLNIVASGVFTNGEQFQLFSGAGATNTSNFATLAGSPGSGLAFSFANGILSVVASGPTAAGTLTNSYHAGVLSLTWPAGQNWRLQAQTNSLSKGLSTNWVYVTDGTVSSTNITVDPTKPTMFYRLTYP